MLIELPKQKAEDLEMHLGAVTTYDFFCLHVSHALAVEECLEA